MRLRALTFTLSISAIGLVLAQDYESVTRNGYHQIPSTKEAEECGVLFRQLNIRTDKAGE